MGKVNIINLIEKQMHQIELRRFRNSIYYALWFVTRIKGKTINLFLDKKGTYLGKTKW